MYLYNITIIVENDIRDAVKTRLHAELSDNRDSDGTTSLLELLDSPHDGTTYCLQFRCKDKEYISSYQANGLAALQTALNAQYPGKVVFFDSMMKYLNDSLNDI